MKKFILILFAIPFVSFSQMLPEKEIAELRSMELTELSKIQEGGTRGEALKQEIRNKYNLLEQKAISEYTRKENIRKQNEEISNAQKRNSDEIQKNQNSQQSQNYLQQLKTQQENSRQSFYNEMNNSLNSFANSMQNAAMMQVYNNLKARQYTIDNFAKENQQKLDKILTIYNTIPKDNFKKVLNGTYKAYFISNKKYCYAPDYELSYVEDCYVNVKSNVISNIYMFGNKELENNLPSENPENSMLNNGFVKYINLDNLETYNIVIIEPYLKNVDSNLSLRENNVGYITLWSSNKEDEGKIVYVQELFDKYTKLNREIAVKIQYAKNEKEIKANTNASKTPFNLNYTIFYLGEVTNTPYGRIPLATKISDPKENNKELTSNEHRYVQVKKYRE